MHNKFIKLSALSIFVFMLPFHMAFSKETNPSKKIDEKVLEEVTLEIMLKSLPGKEPEMKRKIIRQISIHGDSNGVAPMIFIMLDTREDFDTRREAAKAAMFLGGEKEFSPILKVLEGKRSFECRDLINILVEISDKRFIAPLIEYTSLVEVEDDCRKPAVRAYLKMMGDDRDFDFSVLKDTEGERYLVKVAEEWANYYQRRSIYILGELKSNRAVHALLKGLAGKDYGIKVEAIRALGKIKNSKSAAPLGLVLKNDPTLSLKEECIKGLVNFESGQSTKEIEKYFKKSSLRHKSFILRIIKSCETRYAKRLINKLIRSEKNKSTRDKLRKVIK